MSIQWCNGDVRKESNSVLIGGVIPLHTSCAPPRTEGRRCTEVMKRLLQVSISRTFATWPTSVAMKDCSISIYSVYLGGTPTQICSTHRNDVFLYSLYFLPFPWRFSKKVNTEKCCFQVFTQKHLCLLYQAAILLF